MEQNLGAQPDFDVTARALQTVTDEIAKIPNLLTIQESNAVVTAIQDMERRFQAQMQGMEERLSAQMQAMEERLSAQMQAMEERLSAQIQTVSNRVSAAEHNTMARFQNKGLRTADAELTMLHTAENNPIENFPETPAALQQLAGPAITRLLTALKMSTSGTVDQKRARLRIAIGLHEITVTLR